MDYNPKAEITQMFFAEVQNKLHFAIHGHTAAELIVKRADSKKDRMGLTTWKNAPRGKILKPDVVIAKNYLAEEELRSLDRFITMYRIVQDRLFESDFDRHVNRVLENNKQVVGEEKSELSPNQKF